jgi:N-acylneuraminate cytidylyltransferase
MRDGMGLELACENGLNIIIMTSEDSEIVRKRMEKLKIKYVYLGVKDKYSRLENIINKINIKRNQIAYVGDDTNDLSNICSVAWGIVPNDGIDIVKLKADLVLKRNGGNAIREAVSFILNYNKKF